jgi:hypothetical protein
MSEEVRGRQIGKEKNRNKKEEERKKLRAYLKQKTLAEARVFLFQKKLILRSGK